MKNILLISLFLLFISSLTSAQSLKGNGNVIKKEFSVSDVENISNLCSANLFITQSNSENLTVEIDDNLVQYFKYNAGDHNIEIDLKGRGISPTKFNVYLDVKHLITLKNNGSGDIRTMNIINSDDFCFMNTGSGDCHINVNSKTFNSEITGSGNATILINADICNLEHTGSGDLQLSNENKSSDLTLKNTGSGNSKVSFKGSNIKVSTMGSGDTKLEGETVNSDISSLGSGDIDGEGFKTDNCTIKISGSGDVGVMCNKTADIEILGSGNLKLTGDYKINKINISGSGKLIK